VNAPANPSPPGPGAGSAAAPLPDPPPLPDSCPPSPCARPPLRSRTVFAAAHVVADPSGTTPGGPAALDWDATLAFRHHL